MRNKVILTDADGVLINWIDAFHDWAQNVKGFKLRDDHAEKYAVEDMYVGMENNRGHEFVHEFNRTDHIRNLSSFRDSVKYVKKLAEDGYVFHCITAIEQRPDIVERRTENLYDLFGPVFSEISCTGGFGTITDKKTYLERYKDTHCYWLEDTIKHAMTGHELGLETVLMTHHYNAHFEHDDIHVVHTWEEIYDLIRSSE